MLGTVEIRLAYELLLGREADAEGLAHFEKLARDGMDIRDLRADIMRSAEFRGSVGGSLQIVQAGDVLVVVDPNEPEFGQHIAQNGDWEPHIIETLRRNLKAGDTFLDIGANVGIMSFTAARLVGGEGKVIAFEPHPANIRSFLAGANANSFHNITLYGFGLSSEEAVFSLYGSSNGFLMGPGKTIFQTVALAGDPLLAEECRLDFIKIDIEGHEPHALSGLRNTIARHKPIILCEYNPRCLVEHIGCEPRVFAEQLFEIGGHISIVEYDAEETAVADVDTLMSIWEQRNAETVSGGFLPDGMLHFDLLLRP